MLSVYPAVFCKTEPAIKYKGFLSKAEQKIMASIVDQFFAFQPVFVWTRMFPEVS